MSFDPSPIFLRSIIVTEISLALRFWLITILTYIAYSFAILTYCLSVDILIIIYKLIFYEKRLLEYVIT